jgi:CRISPR-associated protein Cas1
MIHRVVDIQEPGQHAHLERGFLVVAKDHTEVGRVPLDDIAALIFSGQGNSVSTNLLAELSERSICAIFCSSNQHPQAMVLPYDTHHLHRTRLEAQINASEPLRKRLWQQIVRAKIAGQGAALTRCTQADPLFPALIARVGSGDPENIEAQAARRYWSALFGESFTRDQARPGLNGVLNYGYAILRAATARAIVGAGLYPALGLHHRNQGNSFVLADDLMEPFRPLVDAVVFDLWRAEGAELTTAGKRRLARLLVADVATDDGYTIVATALHTAAQSLARSLLEQFPVLILPADLFPSARTPKSET